MKTGRWRAGRCIGRAMVAALLGLGAGCGPLKLSATLFADDSRLEESMVATDRGAENAKVAQIDIRGLISDRVEGGLITQATNPVDDLAARLRKAEQDPQVKAVIIRINSPGGTVTASDMMYREVRRFVDESKKPVVTSLGEIAASGGYYLALSGDRIIAEPTSITGSIGVIIPTVNVSEGLGRIGIHSRSIVSRPNKDLANPLEQMREEHYAVLQEIVNEFYARFRGLVIERRSAAAAAAETGSLGKAAPRKALDVGKIEELTDGRVMTGVTAERVGLVDSVGGIPEAFQTAKDLAGIKKAMLVKYYREDEDKPRSAYARSNIPPAGSAGDINLLQIRMNGLGALGGLESAGAYYLWVPPGG